MSGWEQAFLSDAPGMQRAAPEPAPLVPAEPAPKSRRFPIFVNPVVLQAQALGKLGEASAKTGKAAFVRMPCFTC